MYPFIDVDQMPDNILLEISFGHEKEPKDLSLKRGLRHARSQLIPKKEVQPQ